MGVAAASARSPTQFGSHACLLDLPGKNKPGKLTCRTKISPARPNYAGQVQGQISREVIAHSRTLSDNFPPEVIAQGRTLSDNFPPEVMAQGPILSDNFPPEVMAQGRIPSDNFPPAVIALGG